MVVTETLRLESPGNFYPSNITERVRSVVAGSGVRNGSVLVFYKHTTGALLLTEHEVGILVDLEDLLEKLAPLGGEWNHHRRGFDANGGAHIRSALFSVSQQIPIIDGELALGTFQELMMVDFNPAGESKERKVIVQVSGE